MTNWFFLSHARFDRDPENDPRQCISKFYTDLLATIRLRRAQGSNGFFDGTGVQQGDRWPDTLAEALRTCRVLVCMYSVAYFNSEYCAKEFRAFLWRLEKYPDELPPGVRRPPLILPVLFSVPEDVRPLKPLVSDIQDVDDEYPAAYRQNGLHYLMVRKNQKDNYQNFLDKLAGRIIGAAERWKKLPAPKVLPDIEGLRGDWEQDDSPSGALQEELEEDEPLQYAEFVYVAAKRAEIGQLADARPRLDYYGRQGGLDFKPYYPAPPKTVGLFAQEIATREGFNYQPALMSGDLVKQIMDARSQNRIVIIIVDTWTLKLPVYNTFVRCYDDLDPLNSSMLIVWDNKDAVTLQNRASLENKIRFTFPVKCGRGEAVVFNYMVGSQSDLEKFLPVALQELRARIIEVNKTFRTVGDGGPVPRLSGK